MAAEVEELDARAARDLAGGGRGARGPARPPPRPARPPRRASAGPSRGRPRSRAWPAIRSGRGGRRSRRRSTASAGEYSLAPMPWTRAALLALLVDDDGGRRHARAGQRGGHRALHHRPALPERVDRVRPRVGHRAVALRLPGPRGGCCRRAHAQRPDPGLLPRPGRGLAARPRGDHRAHRRGPRDRARRHRGRGRHPRPAPAEGRHGRPGRSAADRSRAGGRRDRGRASHLLLQRRPPRRRDGQRGDAHGARLPARGLGRPARSDASARTWSS